MRSRAPGKGFLRVVVIGDSRAGLGEGLPIGVPVAVYSVYPQGKHGFGMLGAPPALLGDVAMSALDLAGREVDDGALQRPRTPQRAHLRLEHERTHAPLPQPILRLPDLYLAEFRMPAEFFLPWRCI